MCQALAGPGSGPLQGADIRGGERRPGRLDLKATTGSQERRSQETPALGETWRGPSGEVTSGPRERSQAGRKAEGTACVETLRLERASTPWNRDEPCVGSEKGDGNHESEDEIDRCSPEPGDLQGQRGSLDLTIRSPPAARRAHRLCESRRLPGEESRGVGRTCSGRQRASMAAT